MVLWQKVKRGGPPCHLLSQTSQETTEPLKEEGWWGSGGGSSLRETSRIVEM